MLSSNISSCHSYLELNTRAAYEYLSSRPEILSSLFVCLRFLPSLYQDSIKVLVYLSSRAVCHRASQLTYTILAAPVLNRSTVVLGFQISDFAETGHPYTRPLAEPLPRILDYVTANNFPPPRTTATAATAGPLDRRRTRSESVDLIDEPSWPSDWAIDKTAFKKAYKQFHRESLPLLEYLDSLPHSTGNTPKATSVPAENSSTDPPSNTPAADSTQPTTPSMPENSDAPGLATAANNPVVDPNLQAIISAAIAQYVQSNPPPPGPPGPRGLPGIDGVGGNGALRPEDIGFLDTSYGTDSDGPIANAGRHVFYRDVYAFTDRLEAMAAIRGDDKVRDVIPACLRGDALQWHLTELTDLERDGLRYSPLKSWTATLVKRFKERATVAVQHLQSEKYTVSDARNGKTPRSYVQSILRHAKAAEFTSTYNQLAVAWNNLALEFRRDIPEPTASTTLKQFLEQLDAKSSIWFELSRQNRFQQSQPQQIHLQKRQGQYNPQSQRSFASQNPFRPAGYVTDRPYRPFNDTNPYANRPFAPGASFGSGANNNSQQANRFYQQQRPYQQQGPSYQQQAQQPKQLQITNGNANANASTGQQTPKGNNPFRPQQNSQQPFNRFQQQRYGQPRFARTYQYAADDDQRHEDTYMYDDQAEYEAYEDAFYEGANWASQDDTFDTFGNDSQASENQGTNEDSPDTLGDTVEGHFAAAPTSLPYKSRASKPSQCRKCLEHFPSSNELHRHLRSDAHPNATIAPLDATPAVAQVPTTETFFAGVPEIIPSDSTDEPTDGYAFRGFRYVTAMVTFSSNMDRAYELCFDTGCTMSLIDRRFLHRICPDMQISKMQTPMTVKGIGNRRHQADEYVKLKMYLPDDKQRVALIERELHLVDDLSAKALIGIDIMKPESMTIDLGLDIMKIGSCKGLTVPITVHTRGVRTNTTVFSSKTITVPAHSNLAVSITGPRQHLDLPDRDLIFEPHTLEKLSAYAHIVSRDTGEIFLRNDTPTPITLPRRTRLGNICELESLDCYAIASDNHDLALKPPKRLSRLVRSNLRRLLVSSSAFSAALEPDECVHPIGITIHGDVYARQKLSTTIEQFPTLWQDSGNVVGIPDSEFMEIPLLDNWKELYKPGQAKVYPVGQKDKAVIDDAFDRLHRQDRMEWTTTATPFSFPCFVVWKDTPNSGPKGRVVVDIRALNKITMPDAYPVPSQAEILAEVRNSKFISTVDAASFFYQWWVKPTHRHRLTVSSHRGQESFKVPVMGYRNSPAYVQRMIDRILRPFRQFCRAYVDDIVIYSSTLDEHIQHLQQVFGVLAKLNIHLSPKKSFLGYPSVQLLGQKVDALGLATAEDKLAAISNLQFPKTLAQLEKYLGLTGYLRQYIAHYAAITKPLQQRKTYLNKSVKDLGPTATATGHARKRIAHRTNLSMPTPKELNAFHQLQKLFSSPTVLVHFDETRTLFVDLDASKEWGFGAHVYHVMGDNATPSCVMRDTPILSGQHPRQQSQQSILFLSRLLNDAETRYWPTELEIAGLVWVVKKIRHMIEASRHDTVIYTDHSAAVSLVRQTSLNTTSVDKLNLRLIRASEYLQRFRLDVRYKPGKVNIVPDALSRLASRDYKPSDSSLDSLYADVSPIVSVCCFPVSLVEMNDDFRQRLLRGYQEPRWARVITMVKENGALGDDAADLAYKLVNDLLYFNDDERGLRLCIPSSMEHEVFKLAHDEMGHPGYARTHERLTQGLYIFNLSKKLHEFLRHCPHCQLNQTPRHKPYGSLQPIYSPARPFHTLTLDFILALPKSRKDLDCIMSVTDKFSKAVTLLPGKITYSGKDWAIELLDRLAMLNWGLPRAIISDRDRKFLGAIWKQIFDSLQAKLLYSAAWHPQTDGMSERSNQTVEIALRYYIGALEDNRDWPAVLPRMSSALNNSTNYSSTSLAPNQILYGFKTREALDLMRIEDPDDTPVSANDTQDAPANDTASTPTSADDAQGPLDTSPNDTNNTDRATAGTNSASNDDNTGPTTTPYAFPVTRSSQQGHRLAATHDYRPAHIDAKDAIAFASLRMKEYYDSHHMPMFFDVGDLVNLRLHKGYKMPAITSKKIGPQLVGPFKVLERIGRLAYRLELPPNMRIHNVISVAHLEPATDPVKDPYKRHRTPAPEIVVDGEIEYEIDRLLQKRRVRRGRGTSLQYLVRWLNCGPEDDMWLPVHRLANARDKVDEYEERYGIRNDE